jgi:hypothetical protein
MLLYNIRPAYGLVEAENRTGGARSCGSRCMRIDWRLGRTGGWSWVGTTFLGLSGAAATSAGLALLGGGSVAAGGLGVAGGTAIVAATSGAVGSAAAWVAAKTLGKGLIEGKNCERCHFQNELAAKFCINCGKEFGLNDD